MSTAPRQAAATSAPQAPAEATPGKAAAAFGRASHSFRDRLRPALSLAGGLLFTYLLFTGIGLLQHEKGEVQTDFTDVLSDVSVPPPPPPPPMREAEVRPPDENLVDLIGFQLARTESPVKIEATPLLIDPSQQSAVPPAAFIRSEFGTLSVKPTIKLENTDPQHIYNGREVDQRAAAIFKKKPRVRGSDFDYLKDPKINLLFVVDAKGKVSEVRVTRSTGSAELDELIVKALREWEFTPAMKNGRPVRQWFEQLINIEIGAKNPFSTD